MNKYQNDLIIDVTKNIPYYLSVLPETVPMEDVPFYYTTRQGDRLDTLANAFYKTPNKWWVIAKANNIVNGNTALPAGLNLFIPNV